MAFAIRKVPLIIETEAFEGVKRIGAVLCRDIELVTGERPELFTEENLRKESLSGKNIILCATVGKSPLLARLEQEKKLALSGITLSEIEGKREVYQLALVKQPFAGVEEALLILGSDKRGTIYGMFSLSEYLGVTPLVYWGDAAPARNREIMLREDICMVSKEPSVFYRGFFINDEWPCFGTWVTSRFGDFNAKAYEVVFEFLLRMKGNYLWPAMWTASFPLDGPGEENEKLADIYGIVIGYSHHEPCLRASEEWDKVKGKQSVYGEAWNFYTNEKGLLRYWEDGLKRSGSYEKVITIGMRGERDTSMLGEDATVAENVALLKKIITKQRQLIRSCVNEDISKVPQLLALYKEVEAYFYGEQDVPGLKDWAEIEDVICMLCEDNFGNTRTLPSEEIRAHRGGFGMYYHLDYHGGPVSYEWIDSTPLSKIWEQMCMVYEYGVRKLWIVNAGDVKFHEVPLTYFMALAYDFEKWGSSNPDSVKNFTENWAKQNFPAERETEAAKEAIEEAEAAKTAIEEAAQKAAEKAAKKAVIGNAPLESVISQEAFSYKAQPKHHLPPENLQQSIAECFTRYIDLLSLRRPEALTEETYHPCHYLETDRLLGQVQETQFLSEQILSCLSEQEKQAYYSMVHFPLTAGMNLLKLQLYAGKNRQYAKQGRPIANVYLDKVQACIEKDRQLAEEWSRFAQGKWDGMQLAPHIGFRKWNEDGWRYPVLYRVMPVPKPRLSVSRKDREEVFHKNYGSPCTIVVEDFLDAGSTSVWLEIANDGVGSLHYEILPQEGEWQDWLSVSEKEGEVEQLAEVELRCVPEKLPEKEPVKTRLLITDGDTTVAVEISARKGNMDASQRTFYPRQGVITMDAVHYCRKKDTAKGAFQKLEGYGKYGSGVKVFPVTASFLEKEEKPELTYRFFIQKAAVYQVELLTAPCNSVKQGESVQLQIRANQQNPETLVLIPSDFQAGDYRDARWCQAVLNQIRSTVVEMDFAEGIQEITIGALEAGVVLERIRIYEKGKLLESYLGPEESPDSQNMQSNFALTDK